MDAMGSLITSLRGGGAVGAQLAAFETAVTGSLTSASPLGVIGLTAIAAAVVTPLTIYKQAYAFSVAYGFCVAAMGGALLATFSPTGTALSLASAVTFYGLRLGGHLLLREVALKSKREQLKTFDKTPRLKRIPFSLSVSLFYAFMVTPAMVLCRQVGNLSARQSQLVQASVAVAWFGAIVEAWTDFHKFWAKRGKDGNTDFLGPTSWWYSVSRHPNYLGEILFWAGVYTAGLTALVASGQLWFGLLLAGVSTSGFYGILQIMLGATKRLDQKQEDKYGKQKPYQEWKSGTEPLFAKVSNPKSLAPVAVTAAGVWAAIKYVPGLLAGLTPTSSVFVHIGWNVLATIAVSLAVSR